MNSQITTIIGGIVRHLVGLVAGGLITSGAVSSSEVEVITGGVTGILVVAWSIWQKSRVKA